MTVMVEVAEPRWRAFADVLVSTCDGPIAEAAARATALLAEFPGCLLVAVGCAGNGCVVRFRGDWG
ncbi:hypothetical protein [Allokutzneria oryzae]|uniref:Uncharacterized protein n=1 Tax=Allokutzneria oryzae TaxID=1378989 RepID=A0ABV6AAU2_9PSEU